MEHLARRYTMFRRILATLMLLGMLGALAGCNTMVGVGKDIERGGEATQDAAKDVQRNM
jgi:predicted small secreted protein